MTDQNHCFFYVALLNQKHFQNILKFPLHQNIKMIESQQQIILVAI